MELEEKRRPGRVKLSLVLGVLGLLMVLAGFFAGSASGDSDSPWYMVAIMGLMCITAVGLIWVMAFPNRQNDDSDRQRR